MKLVLVVALGASGCFLPAGDDGELAPATARLTGVQTFVADGDARVLVMLRDDAASEARLVRYDVRDDQIVELDRMPIGDGVAQIMRGRAAIVWGFGGSLPDAGRFRVVDDDQARDLAFGAHAPSVLLGQHYEALTFASTQDCTIETLELATGALEVRAAVSCFATFKSVVLDDILGIWVRVDDGDGASVGMIDGLWVGAPSYARTAMPDAIGPFIGPQTYWFVENDGDQARVYQGRTHEWPVPAPIEYARVDTTIEAGALVDGELWGAAHGYLFPVGSGGLTVRYPVSYQPLEMVGLTGRLMVQLADGTLLEQPLDAL